MQVIIFFTKWIPLFFIQDMYENNMPERRYAKTLSFLKEQLPPPANIIDLGVINPFSERMLQAGYKVFNTGGEDLDEVRTTVEEPDYDCCTAFEIFEHLLSPYELLKSIKAPELVGSIPLNVWFAPPHRNPNDPRDRHYHEFYPWQFDWLLEKTGWEIVRSETWASPDRLRPGIRPLLRFIWPSYYFFHARRK